MTKLPQTISKLVNIFTGKELPTGCKPLRVGDGRSRCVGGTTAVALRLLSEAQLNGAAFSFDHANYEASYSEMGARNLMATLKDVIYRLGYSGFSLSIRNYDQLRGHVVVRNIGTLPNPYSHGVLVEFNPIVEVHYDLRKS